MPLMPTLPMGAECKLMVDSKAMAFVVVRHHSTTMEMCTMFEEDIEYGEIIDEDMYNTDTNYT